VIGFMAEDWSVSTVDWCHKRRYYTSRKHDEKETMAPERNERKQTPGIQSMYKKADDEN